MSFGVRTRDSVGNLISEFDGEYLRFVDSIRMEALETGSKVLPGDITKMRYFFVPDEPVSKIFPVIDFTSNSVTWRPYLTGHALHTGGFILIGTTE